jgi:hypothetical protein
MNEKHLALGLAKDTSPLPTLATSPGLPSGRVNLGGMQSLPPNTETHDRILYSDVKTTSQGMSAVRSRLNTMLQRGIWRRGPPPPSAHREVRHSETQPTRWRGVVQAVASWTAHRRDPHWPTPPAIQGPWD